MILNFDLGKIGVGILCVTLSLLVLIIAYRKLLAYLGKGSVPKEKYCTLHRIEKNPAHGELEFYFTTEESKFVTFEFLDDNFAAVHLLASREFDKGGHILRLDSTQFKNGSYYYQLKTDNQKTCKKIEILN